MAVLFDYEGKQYTIQTGVRMMWADRIRCISFSHADKGTLYPAGNYGASSKLQASFIRSVADLKDLAIIIGDIHNVKHRVIKESVDCIVVEFYDPAL